MDTQFPKSLISIFSLILFGFIIVLCSFPAVRSEPESVSEPTIIRLPSESEPADACGRSTRSASSCPVNCFRPDPVCGVDGVTYWCGCQDAQCAGVKVEKLGFCVRWVAAAPPPTLLKLCFWFTLFGSSSSASPSCSAFSESFRILVQFDSSL
nr:uncharacterized protein LOC103444613 [Malus domestica]